MVLVYGPRTIDLGTVIILPYLAESEQHFTNLQAERLRYDLKYKGYWPYLLDIAAVIETRLLLITTASLSHAGAIDYHDLSKTKLRPVNSK